MAKVYIGIDAHKDSNVLALAFAGNEPPELYGKRSHSYVDTGKA
jgi:hypothetical protein